jgi:hypothetical protein
VSETENHSSNPVATPSVATVSQLGKLPSTEPVFRAIIRPATSPAQVMSAPQASPTKPPALPTAGHPGHAIIMLPSMHRRSSAPRTAAAPAIPADHLLTPSVATVPVAMPLVAPCSSSAPCTVAPAAPSADHLATLPARAATVLPDALGRLVLQATQALQSSPDWATFITKIREPSDLACTVGLLPHPANALLAHLATTGVPVTMTTAPWTLARRQAALA